MPNEITVIINGKEEKIPQSRNEYLLLDMLERFEEEPKMCFCDTTADLPEETESLPTGTVCAVINESKFYVLNSQKVWKLWDDEEETSIVSSVSSTQSVLKNGLEIQEVQNESLGTAESE